MITETFTLVAATPQVLLTGAFVIRQLVFNGDGAGTVSVYDAETTDLTQSNAAYASHTQDCTYTREITGIRDLACNLNDYGYAGVSNTDITVAADAAYPLRALAEIGIPAAGQQSMDMRLLVARGLMANSTVGGTLQVTYEVAH